MNIRPILTSLAGIFGFVFAVHAGGMNPQIGNLILASGNLMVQVDHTGNVVDGVFLSISPVTDVSMDSRGYIWVAANNYPSPQTIHRISADGATLSTNESPVAFQSFASAPAGDVVLGQGTTVFRLDSALNFIDAFPIVPAPGSAPSVSGISVDAKGQIYVIAGSQNGQSSVIYKLDTQGNILQNLGSFPFEIRGLAAGTNGHVFYARKNTDNAGFPLPSLIVELDSNGVELGSFQAPIQVAGMALIVNAPTPNLSIRCLGNEIILEWPLSGSDFELQSASFDSPGSWIGLGIKPVSAGSGFQVGIPASSTGTLFRLRRLP